MTFLDLIHKKKHAEVLSREEIFWFVDAYVKGSIPDYQVAAMLMAIWFQKLNERETLDLTYAMRDSGAIVDLSDIPGTIVDKHSTGGVADTTTLIVTPIVAACGLKVAKMSGRGLGHTGGTVDKLESIPGFSTTIEIARFKQIVETVGLAVVGQSQELAPADKLLYALRDTTATIDNISLISASIMSKKLASGADTIVLDVKVGNGGFMEDEVHANQLATMMVAIGKKAGKKTVALITDMNQPLGNAIGNSLEVKEAIEILKGAHRGDLQKVSIELAAQLLFLEGKAATLEEGRQKAHKSIESGQALGRLGAMIEAQGGDPRVCQDTNLFPAAKQIIEVKSPKSGIIQSVETAEIGRAAMLLGAGRLVKTDTIDLAVGIWLHKRVGDQVEKGEAIADFHANDMSRVAEAQELFVNAYRIESGDQPPKTLIYSTIT